MQIDIVNSNNEKIGALELSDDVFGGRVKGDLIWRAVVQQNASERRGTHATKNRANVSGSGKKPWRQKGTGRARVGEIRNPLWRKGGTVFGPQPRSYAFDMPKKVRRGALAAALTQKLHDGAVIVVDRFETTDRKTKTTAEMLKRLGVAGTKAQKAQKRKKAEPIQPTQKTKTLLIDLKPDEAFSATVRNIAGVTLVSAQRVTARDVIDTGRVVATRDALEKLQESLS